MEIKKTNIMSVIKLFSVKIESIQYDTKSDFRYVEVE
jgi:hypothetical protein